MPSRSALADLPLEITEAIITKLAFKDICNLRLTASYIAQTVSQGCFRTYFHHKTVNLTSEKQLEEFVHMTGARRVGCLVQCLTLTYILPPRVEKSKGGGDPGFTAQDHTQILVDALRNIQAQCGRLGSLVLKAEREGDELADKFFHIQPAIGRWEPIWDAAEWMLRHTLLALHDSALAIERLDIFRSVLRCSLGCDRLGAILNSIDLTTTLEGLNHVSLSLSDRQVHDSEDQNSQPSLAGEKPSEAICRFFRLCPSLESVELHWYLLNSGTKEDRHFFNRMATSVRLPSLRSLSLRGIDTTERALLRFLSAAPLLTSLTMEQVCLVSGKLGRVIDYVRPRLVYLYLDDLWEGSHLHFDAPGEPHFPRRGRDVKGPNKLVRRGLEAQQALNYWTFPGSQLGHPKFNQWLRRRALHYGPPGR